MYYVVNPRALSFVYGRNGREIAMVGDLFVDEEDYHEDTYADVDCADPEKRAESRALIREIKPKVVIPAHDKPFFVKY